MAIVNLKITSRVVYVCVLLALNLRIAFSFSTSTTVPRSCPLYALRSPFFGAGTFLDRNLDGKSSSSQQQDLRNYDEDNISPTRTEYTREKPLPREEKDVIEKFRQQLSSLQEDVSKLAQENQFWNFAKFFSPVSDESDTSPQRPNFGFRLALVKDVPDTTIGGSALAASSLSLLGGLGVALAATAGVGAAFLSVSEGPGGEAMRKVGDVTWELGQRVINLSDKPALAAAGEGSEASNPRVEPLPRRATEILEQFDNFKRNGEDPGQIQDQLIELRDFAKALYLFNDEFQAELEKLEAELVGSSSEYRRELQQLEIELQELIKELENPS